MSNNDNLRKVEEFTPDVAKSIFLAFAVNVPMPRDTAVPGSYTQPQAPGQSGSNSK